MSDQQPTVGRVVHYVSQGSPVLPDGSQVYPSVCRAAIVTEVNWPKTANIGLAVLNPTGLHFDRAVKHDEGQAAGTWHWPERA